MLGQNTFIKKKKNFTESALTNKVNKSFCSKMSAMTLLHQKLSKNMHFVLKLTTLSFCLQKH